MRQAVSRGSVIAKTVSLRAVSYPDRFSSNSEEGTARSGNKSSKTCVSSLSSFIPIWGKKDF